MTTLYIDTEFNEFRGELISLAIVTEDGREWYECINCPWPRDWVKANVLPVLGKKYLSHDLFRASLAQFLSQFETIHVVADWPEDIQHFCWALITGPGTRINTPPLTMEVRRDLDSEDSKIPHNALADARAIRDMACASQTNEP